MGSIDNFRIELDKYEEIISNTSIDPVNVVEIGSQNGWDAERLCTSFNVCASNVYIIEAHPGFYQTIKADYPEYNVYNLAGSNVNGTVSFNAAKNFDDGRSSFLQRDIYDSDIFVSIDVDSIRMDRFMVEHNLDTIDVLKIDVEGATHQVLEGFGERLKDVKSIQLEAELQPFWNDSMLWNELKLYLESKGFKLMWHTNIGDAQTDSVWLNGEYL
jgi:FkbM family methyltransferase